MHAIKCLKDIETQVEAIQGYEEYFVRIKTNIILVDKDLLVDGVILLMNWANKENRKKRSASAILLNLMVLGED